MIVSLLLHTVSIKLFSTLLKRIMPENSMTMVVNTLNAICEGLMVPAPRNEYLNISIIGAMGFRAMIHWNWPGIWEVG